MDKNKRIARNTGFLYVKLLVSTVVSLFSARLVLLALGEKDFGIFNLVGGIITMLAFLNAAMSITTQRYLSFYMGAGDYQKLKKLFGSSVLLHLVIGFVIVLLLEICGLFLFDGFLNIPPERIGTAKIIFHFMVVSTFFTINAVPYDAAINSHENMFFDAIAGIIESFMKLGIALLITHSGIDRLVFYSLLMASLTIAMRFFRSIYCVRKYDECEFSLIPKYDFSLLKEMLSFAAWNLYGSFCSVVRNQGLAVLLNVFYGVVVNAAYGIANQVNGQISAFSASLIRALYPQITKSVGAGDNERMLRLSILACKTSFLLFATFSVPLLVEMPYILKIWLKEVPDNTVIFCQLILILSLVQQFTVGLMAAITSFGEIKVYQILMGSLLLLNIPVSLVLIKLGLPSYSVLVCAIAIEIIAMGSRVWLTHRIIGMKIRHFLSGVVLNLTLSVIVALGLATLPKLFMDESLLRAAFSVMISFISLVFASIFLIFTKDENDKIRYIVLDLLKITKRRPL